MNYLLLQGGVENGDHKALLKASDTAKIFPHWGCLKTAKSGDYAFIYVTGKVGAIVATGRIQLEAQKGLNWPYEAPLGNIKALKQPISLAHIRRTFPKWRWPNYPRSKLVLELRTAEKLLKLARMPLPSGAAPYRAESGAGFGNSELNPRVEKAAMRFVTRDFKRRGYVVTDVSSQNRGYDLTVRKGVAQMHIEVKGVSGSEESFLITSNEIRCARSNKSFHLAIVTQALTKSAKMTVIPAKEFLSRFELRPTGYIARRKG